MQVTREKGALLAALKGMKRQELHNLCKIHDLRVTRTTNQILERSIAEHCVNEHAGRVVALDKCSKAAAAGATARTDAVPGATAAAAPLRPRPLVPQKRAIDAAAADRTAKKRPLEAPLCNSTSTSSSAAPAPAPTLRSLQHALDELTRRLDGAPAPLSSIDAEEMVEARLARHREDVQAALLELKELCRVGFTNMQASFDAVGTWRDEVTATFTQINRWAADVEEKLVPSPAAVHPQQQQQQQQQQQLYISRTPASALPPKHVLSEKRRPPLSALAQLSSTPASHLAQMPRLPCQTPALPPIHASRRRSGRISDASEFSLATIPEQAGGCAEGEEEEDAGQGEKEDRAHQARALGHVSAAGPAGHLDAVPWPAPTAAGGGEAEAVRRSPHKHVRIASPLLSSPVPAHRQHTAPDRSVSPFRAAARIASPQRCPHARDTLGQPARTPAASKTLFGTECSTEERFDDAAPVDNASGHALGTGLPTWTQRSPSWFRGAGVC